MLPLKGIRVVDASRLLPGGFCSMILSDLGADVVKVEEPFLGDYMRFAPPLVDGVSVFHSVVNRNKRSVAINLKKQQGKQILRKLLAGADVFIEGFRPRVMDRLGFGFKDVKIFNNKIVYCSISAFGQEKRESSIPGHDLNFQALSGVFTERSVNFPTVQYADLVSGLYAAIGIISALVKEPREAVHVDVPIVQSLTSLLILHLATHLSEVKGEFDGLLYGEEPYYKLYETSDGKYLAVAAIESKFRKNLARLLHDDKLAEMMSSGKEERKAAEKKLAEVFKNDTRDNWINKLMEEETCVTPVLGIGEVISMKWSDVVYDGKARVLKTPILFKNGRDARRRESSAPSLGENTVEILKALGFKKKKIERLRQKGVIQY